MKDVPFVNDEDSYADLSRFIKGSLHALTPVEDLEEAQAYKDLARAEAQVYSTCHYIF